MFLTQNEKDNLIKRNKHLIVNKRYASLLRRIWGGALDGVIIFVLGLIIGSLVGDLLSGLQFKNINIIVYEMLGTLIAWSYMIYFMSSKKQSPLGYYFAGMRYARGDAKPITTQRATSMMIVTFVAIFSFNTITHQTFGESNGARFIELVLFFIIFGAPYFFTKRKQFLIEYLLGVVVLDTTKDNLDNRSKLNNEISS